MIKIPLAAALPIEALNAVGVARRIHKRIEKEFNRAQYQITFDLDKNTAGNIVKADISPYLRENIKTYNLSNAICKGIDMTWKKSSSKIIPKALNIFVSRFSMGEHVLGAVGLSPKEFKEKIRKKILNVMTGILKQYKTELKNILKQEIIQHLLNCNHDDIETNNICCIFLQIKSDLILSSIKLFFNSFMNTPDTCFYVITIIYNCVNPFL